MLTSVTTAYLPRNLRPAVSSITVHPPGTVFQRPFSTGELEIAGFEDNTSDGRNPSQPSTRPARSPSPPSRPALGRKVYQKGLQTFVWKAEDDNDDRLQYDVFYRREGETAWKPLKRSLWDPIVVWDTTSVPDGTYYVKVAATDAPSNSPATALLGEFESVSFDIDNTPPVVEIQSATRTGSARDGASSWSATSSPRCSGWSTRSTRAAGAWPTRSTGFRIRGARSSRSALDDAEAARSIIIRVTDAMNNVATAVAEIQAVARLSLIASALASDAARVLRLDRHVLDEPHQVDRNRVGAVARGSSRPREISLISCATWRLPRPVAERLHPGDVAFARDDGGERQHQLPFVPDRSSEALTMPLLGTEGAWIIRPSMLGGIEVRSRDRGRIATIIARSESSRSGDAKCSMPSTIAPHRSVAAVDARPIHTRCMSSNRRPTRAGQASFASARIRLITPGCRPGPVVGRSRRRGQAQRRRDRVVAVAAPSVQPSQRVQVSLNRDPLLDRQLVVVKLGEAPPHRRTGQSGHTSLNCARSPSRARARRDFTVPTAMPSENPISS